MYSNNIYIIFLFSCYSKNKQIYIYKKVYVNVSHWKKKNLIYTVVKECITIYPNIKLKYI